jgi:hypothetical protein
MSTSNTICGLMRAVFAGRAALIVVQPDDFLTVPTAT